MRLYLARFSRTIFGSGPSAHSELNTGTLFRRILVLLSGMTVALPEDKDASFHGKRGSA